MIFQGERKKGGWGRGREKWKGGGGRRRGEDLELESR